MPYKMTEDGSSLAMDEKGLPVWIDDAGAERSVDYSAMSAKNRDLLQESMQRKDKIKTLEAKMAPLAEIEDLSSFLEEAQKAMEMARNAPEKEKAIEEQIRGRVEAATKPLNEKIVAAEKQAQAYMSQAEAAMVGSAFSGSKFVNEQLINAAMAKDLFASRFKMHEGKLTAFKDDGQQVFGVDGPATFDEAMAYFVDNSPYKDHLRRGSDKSGSGAAPNSSAPARGNTNPWKKETYNATTQMNLFVENPALAKRMMEEAGVPVPQGI